MANLEDLIDPEYGLQQDEWSLARPRFGVEGQLEVIGWSGKAKTNNKLYILRCSECARDRELFGEGLFKSLKSNLVNRSNMCCGCSKRTLWSQDQYAVKCKRALSDTGYTFVRFYGEWQGAAETKVVRFCAEHGERVGGTVLATLRKPTSCPICQLEIHRPKLLKANTKADSEMIESFIESGAFAEGTNFIRSERKTKCGRRKYWLVFCPECGGRGEATSDDLQRGSRACSCSVRRQKEAYINFVSDNGALALKFGIANNSSNRTEKQKRTCIYVLENFGVWEFETKKSCLAAERECKQTLECGVLTKEEMPDGYTETTWLYNLEKIIAIYEKHGGKRIK